MLSTTDRYLIFTHEAREALTQIARSMDTLWSPETARNITITSMAVEPSYRIDLSKGFQGRFRFQGEYVKFHGLTLFLDGKLPSEVTPLEKFKDKLQDLIDDIPL